MNNHIIEFYIRKFDYTDNIEGVDVSFLPPIIRRRLSLIDKASVYLLNNVFTDDIQNIVFSSQFGETDRLIKIIDQYSENNEISPNVFSGSVHNYPAAFYLLNIQKPIPYNAVASGPKSISYGLLTAAVSAYDNVLYCYSDKINDGINAFALNISKNKTQNSSKFLINFKKNSEYSELYSDFIHLFKGDINMVNTESYGIERVK